MADCINGLKVGDTVTKRILINDDTINKYMDVSGDYSPIHADENYAANTKFGKRIVHGMLIGAFFSRIIGMELPGPGSIYVQQSMRFVAPVFIGQEIQIIVIVKEIDIIRNRCKLSTQCLGLDEKLLVDGIAEVIPPKNWY